MVDIRKEFKEYCRKHLIPGSEINSVKPYDESTLFCIAGMQRFKQQFYEPTNAIPLCYSIQACLRVDDIDLIGDASHFPLFNMLGLFSFNYQRPAQAIAFWINFLASIGVKPTHVTIHPNKYDEWKETYLANGITDIRKDEGCIWGVPASPSCPAISGYCTEFFVGDVEIGNIVNPMGTCIDCGFGLERISNIVNHLEPPKPEETILKIVTRLEADGYKPSANNQGYILRKVLRKAILTGLHIPHPLAAEEISRQQRNLGRYMKMATAHPEKDDAWWFDTHGIDLSFIPQENRDTLEKAFKSVTELYDKLSADLAKYELNEKESPQDNQAC